MNLFKISPQHSYITLITAALAFPSPALYADKPLWELGIGLVAFNQSHYLGAAQSHNLLLPFPYIVYRGEKVEAENGRVKGLLFNSDKLEIDVSLGGSLPVNSNDNRLREGMPDLNPILEIGPSVKWKLLNRDNQQWQLELPLRWAHSIDGSDIEQQGWISTPQLSFSHETEMNRWRFSMGAVYGNQQFQDYFYKVAPEHASAQRPEFQSSNGLMAYRSTLSYEKRIKDIVIGAYAAYYDMSDSASRNSPLLADKGNISVALRIAWVLRKSKKMVKARN